jgi:Alpha/beta hydrolase family
LDEIESTGSDLADVGSGALVDDRRSRRWWPFGAAGALLIAVAWAVATAWGGIRGSHPAYLVTLAMVTVGALALAAWAWRSTSSLPDSPRRLWPKRVGLACALVAIAVVVALVVYLRPLSADQVSIDAMTDGNGVDITESRSSIRLDPIDTDSSSGLVFYPGAKVDPRAYVRILRPIAEAGYPVVITKPPFNLAILGSNAASDFIGDPGDDIDNWVVGGHSLGGAMAARYAETDHDEFAGLLLYAAYPVVDMSGRSSLQVTSVYGTNDTVASVADIDESRAELPSNATFVAIDGGIHAFFGDYGSQHGDGTPTIDRTEAQRQTSDASLVLLGSIDDGRALHRT